MSDDLLIKQDGDILHVTLNRPDDGNGMSNEMAIELTGVLMTAHEKVRIVTITGAGDDYCIGRASGRPPPSTNDALTRRNEYDAIFNCYTAFRDSKIPIVSKVRGRALGFGCTIAALSDITIAADDAVFQVPEMAHRIVPTMVMSGLIDRVTPKVMNYLVYTTNTFSSERAMMYGIVSDIAPAAKLDEMVDDVFAKILRTPPPASLAVKEYLRNAAQMPTAGATDYARNFHTVINTSADMKK